MPSAPIRAISRDPMAAQIEEEFQADFSGGENSVADPLYIRPNECSKIQNLMYRRGGGLTIRQGFKNLGAMTGQGRSIFEFDQALPTVLTHVAAGPSYYEEQAQPSFRLFNATPGTNDAVYIGSREKFTQLILNIIFTLGGAGNTFQWQVSNGAGSFIDKTAQIVESVANSIQMRGAAGEWLFSWPDFSDWLPQQVETREYQYWLKIHCTAGGVATGSDVQHGQKRVRGNFLGHRMHMTASLTNFQKWPGFTVSRTNIEVFGNGLRVDRVRGVPFNDYFYYASAGQRPLKRWNGALGVTRSGASNSPDDAGLVAPPSLVVGDLVLAGNPNAYPAGTVLRYRTAYEYGPEGRLGVSPPGGSAQQTTAGVDQITINLATEIAAAATRDVHAIRVYATDDLRNTQVAERDDISRYYLIARVVRDDATWVAGAVVDTFLPRSKTEPTPVPYTNTPPFYPKYVAVGGERLWIADDYNVAWSDLGRGDSWNPVNTKQFHSVRGIAWRHDRLLVWHDADISFIADVNTGLPNIQYFYRGLGCIQADTIVIGEDHYYFMSRRGPACIYPNDSVDLMASGRVFESTNYWSDVASERDLAQAAYFRRRLYVPIDVGGANQYVGDTALMDTELKQGAWSKLVYTEGVGLPQVWGAMAVVHAPLDHALARQLILVAFPDANGTANSANLRLLEYGSTDNWTASVNDGQTIAWSMETRALAMKFLNRWKRYRRGHVRYKLPGAAQSLSAILLANSMAEGNSKSLSVVPASSNVRDWKFLHTEPDAKGNGPYRGVSAVLRLSGNANAGFDLFSWWTDAEIEDYSLL